VRAQLVGAAMLWGGAAQALDTNDRLTLTLTGGESVSGWFVRAEEGAVMLSVPGMSDLTRVPLSLVEGARTNGLRTDLEVLRREVAEANAQWQAWLADPPPHPPSAVAAGASVVIPGAGQAMLGEWKEASGYVVADLVLLGVGALELNGEQRLSVLVPLVGVDLILRMTSASRAAIVAARRRRRLREAAP